MTSSGYVKIYRQIQDHPFWQGETACRGRAMMDLILLASHNKHAVDIGAHHVELGRGDLAVSVRFLAHRWKWGVRKTASFLARLGVDKFMVKKRNGSGNGSPSVYHIENYDLYQGEMMAEGNGFGNAEETVAKRLRNKTKKGKKGKNGEVISAEPISLEKYLNQFEELEKVTLRQTVEAVSRTRQSGQVALSILDKLAETLSWYPEDVVLRSCRIYLDKDCAAEGKGERYLLGIVRGELKRNGQASTKVNSMILPKSEVDEVDLAIKAAIQRQEKEAEWDSL